MSIIINRDLPNDEYQAAVGANNPSASNVFATISDLLTLGGILHGVASGTNAYTVTIPSVTSYADGDTYVVKFTNGNDDDSTIDINGLGVKTLVKQPNVQVTGGDILAGQEIIIVYDGTNFQCIETAPNQLFAFVTNDDSVTINKGEPVYTFGATGNRMTVKLAFNTSDATSARTIGVVYSTSIAPNQTGFIIINGVVSGLDTSMYSSGDQLYLGATAGSLTNIKPYAPDHLVYIGLVERANAGNGQIYVKVQNGYELDELHDVDLISNPPTDGEVLTYDGGSGLWINEALPATIGENLNINLSPVIDNTITDPSTLAPDYEDAYLVPIGAIGVWAGQDNNIATWDGEQWLFYTPSASDSTTVLTGPNAGYVYTFDGTVWNITITTSPGATPFYIAGSAVDAGGNKTSQIARVSGLTLGSNSGSIGSSPLTVRGTACLENVVARWGLGPANATTLGNWFRIAGFTLSNNTSRNYQILINIGGRTPNTWASATLHINLSKVAGTGKAACRVVNISGPEYAGSLGDNNYRLDETNFEFRRYANAAAGTVTFRLYYKPTVLNTSMSATVLNSNSGGTTGAIGIQWFNTYLGAAIEPPASGGSASSFATFNYSGQRTNISAIIDPTVTDDTNLQYTIGSLWYNTVTVKLWVCMDNTLGAAVWKLLTLTDNDGNVVLPGGLQFSGGFGTANLTANTDNLLITGLASSALVRLTSAGNFQLTGIVVPDSTKAYFFSVFNVGLTGNITFLNDDAGSTAENRFLLGTSILIQPGEGLTFIYDPVDLRWRSPGKNI
jgi:hypothetical protein